MAKADISKLKIDKSQVIPVTNKIKIGKYFYRLLVISIISVLVAFFGKKILIPLPKVEVMTVSQMYPAQAITLLNASGYVAAQRKAAVASKVTGRLISISVEEGSKVKEGQIIARLENEDTKASKDRAEANLIVARANLEQAKADLYEATLNLNRDKELLNRGFIPKSEYDASEARYKKAVSAVAAAEAGIKAQIAAVKEAHVALDYTFIRVPFDAVVLTKNADIGDIVTPLGAAAEAKAAVVTIADLNSLQVEADISESNLEKISVGQPCEIQLDALPSSRFRGIVHMIVPTADRSKATIMVKVRFIDKDTRILPEMSAKVAFLSRPIQPEEQKPRTVLNPAAVINNNGQKKVFVIRADNSVAETKITLGSKMGDMVEVLDGVKAGDRVVIKPPPKLKDGDKIRVAES